MDWKARARCAVIISDASCPGSEYHEPGGFMMDDQSSLGAMDPSPSLMNQVRQIALNTDLRMIEAKPKYIKRV